MRLLEPQAPSLKFRALQALEVSPKIYNRALSIHNLLPKLRIHLHFHSSLLLSYLQLSKALD